MNNEQNIKWGKDGLPELDFDKDGRKQQCLRCFKKPALNDGSEEGEFYCRECIIARRKVDKKPAEDELIRPKKIYKDSLELWEEKPTEEEL